MFIYRHAPKPNMKAPLSYSLSDYSILITNVFFLLVIVIDWNYNHSHSQNHKYYERSQNVEIHNKILIIFFLRHFKGGISNSTPQSIQFKFAIINSWGFNKMHALALMQLRKRMCIVNK